MKYLSVCSGIEAATCAWHPLGWTPAGFSEVEKFPSAVLAHHYPGVPNFGDMTKFQEWPDDLAPDVLVGGTPCQSFSVAGLRKGLDDPRGNLMLTFGSIARRYRPEWLVWENVPGVLSSNGGLDFGTFLGMLAELGYGFAYRVIDAQFFGVAQRRRRVFVVGHLGDWRRAAAVLFDRESLSGHPAPSREAGKGAPTIPSRSSAGGGLGTDFDCDGGLIPSVSMSLNAGAMGRIDVESETFIPVAHSLRGEGFDASDDGTARGTPLVPVAYAIQAGALRTNPGSGPDGVGVQDDHAYTLEARAEVQAVAFNWQGGGTQTSLGYDPESGITGSLHVGQVPAIAGMAVRRLTPRECERLQGFPDDYTRIPWKAGYWSPAKNPPEVIEAIAIECPDGPRYKALGNSMAVPVMRWIGERIQQVGEVTDGK